MLRSISNFLFWQKQKSSTTFFINDLLINKLNTIILQSTEVELIKYGRNYIINLKTISHNDYFNSAIGFESITSPAYLLVMCKSLHSIFKKKINDLQNTTTYLVNHPLLLNIKNELDKQTHSAIEFLNLVMIAIINACLNIENKLLTPEAAFNDLVSTLNKNITTNADNKLQQAMVEFAAYDDTSINNRDLIDIIKYWQNQIASTLSNLDTPKP